ncbi:patatin-like phospholipase family protein [Amycolatopsis ultiminotia]|uniref:Patatin-like phospholipase family protein n=1 Tax=Amycolatopsis ultiminotia TaxID=543629 RepID=A0ABP6W4I4_9PSEU
MPDTGSAKTLVLGGGGAVGIGWQTGLLAGLAEAGLDFTDAGRVIGTSAGSIVGAFLTSGKQTAGAFDAISRLGATTTGNQLRDGSQALMTAMTEAGVGSDPDAALRKIGGLAAAQDTALDEAAFLGLLDSLRDQPWPETLRTTAIDVVTGELRVWGPDDDVNLAQAVAASCAVPMVFPPIGIHGHRYMDGGALSHLNAAAAAGADRVLALSCFPLIPPPGTDEGFAAALQIAGREIEEVRATGAVVEAIEPSPEVFALAGAQGDMLNPQLAEPAHELGHRQARAVLDQVTTAWQS